MKAPINQAKCHQVPGRVTRLRHGAELARHADVALPSNPSLAISAPTRSTAPSEKRGDMLPIDFDEEDYAPSRQTLIRRAAELGPRMTWASIRLQPSDPILGAKMQPQVIERRARFRKVVKVALGACVAFCMIATVASALSSSTASAGTTASAVSRHTPATSVEKLDVLERTKAPSHVVAARPARFAKRR